MPSEVVAYCQGQDLVAALAAVWALLDEKIGQYWGEIFHPNGVLLDWRV